MAQVAATGLTPNLSVRYAIENPNYMNRIVQQFRDEETPALVKVTALALGVLALIGASFLVGQLFGVPWTLVSCIIGFPLSGWAIYERSILHRNEIKAGELASQRLAAAFEEMKKVVGGAAEFERLPVLELNHPCQDYIDWLRPGDLSAPVMRGEFINRPFIAIKVKDAEPRHPMEGELVITFFQRYEDQPAWTYSSAGYLGNDLFNTRLQERDREIIRQIVLDRNHPRFSLVMAENG